MAKEKSPAFQFYPKEFLADSNVSGMSLQELGGYIKLLCICWNDGSLPMATDRLANMVGVPEKVFTKFWPAVRVCFTERDGRYVHGRLDLERQKQAEHRQRASDRGTFGAEQRWRKHRASNAQALLGDSSPISNLQSPISDLRIVKT